MCRSPKFIWLDKGPRTIKQVVNCNLCMECIVSHKNDYVGRCLAEGSTSDYVWFVTLTYRNSNDLTVREDGAERILHRRHFQDWARSLRKRDHKIRYLAVSELGELKGRLHFHALLFGKGKPPRVTFKKRVDQLHWPYGFVYVEDIGEGSTKAFNYVIKYITKDFQAKEGIAENWFTLSKKPPIGDEWLARKAAQNVKFGVFPTTLDYLPPNVKNGLRYPITGTSRRNYMRRIMAGLPDYDWHNKCNRNEGSDWVFKACEEVIIHDMKKDFYALQKGLNHEERKIAMADFLDGITEEQDRARLTRADVTRVNYLSSPAGQVWHNHVIEEWLKHNSPRFPDQWLEYEKDKINVAKKEEKDRRSKRTQAGSEARLFYAKKHKL